MRFARARLVEATLGLPPGTARRPGQRRGPMSASSPGRQQMSSLATERMRDPDRSHRGGWHETWQDVVEPVTFLREVGFKQSWNKMDHLVCFLPGSIALDVLHASDYGPRGHAEQPAPSVGKVAKVLPDAAAVVAALHQANLLGAPGGAAAIAAAASLAGRVVHLESQVTAAGTVLCAVPGTESKLWLPQKVLVEPNATSVDTEGTNGATVRKQRLDFSHALLQACVHMYFRTGSGLAPEITRFAARDLVDDRGSMHSILRPETVESLFWMWRTTGEQIYRNWGLRILSAFSRRKVSFGYASLHNVNEPWRPRDEMPSFFVAETIKYFFMLFSDDDVLPWKDVVMSTEAHVLPTASWLARSGRLFRCGGHNTAAAESKPESES